jgi:uroporphyrinogen-III decarboxylase
VSSQNSSLGEQWASLTPTEKRQKRYEWWRSTEGINFVNAQAEKSYKERIQRMIDVYEVREPDRVPVSVPTGNLPAVRAGLNYHDMMYEPEKTLAAWEKFNKESNLDTYAFPGGMPGPVFDALDYKLYVWPGHKLPVDADGFQFVEGEYMTADEYDDFILDPSDFWMRKYMPRVMGILEPFRMLQPYTDNWEIVNVTGWLMPYTRPEVQGAFKKLMAAADELTKWNNKMMRNARRVAELGYPAARSAMAKAPFDTIGDTLRGTKGIFMDMYRRPDKLMAAMDVAANLTIKSVINNLNASKGLMVTYPLHKGADGWMSEKQFTTFYWPSLKKTIDAFVNEGILVNLFAEGGYDSRLEICNDFPRGAIMWLFDKSDMAHAKKVLGDKCCISGNVPASLLHAGTPGEVKEYCRKLIEVCGKGGGYILAAGNAAVDKANIENIRAMIDAVNEYGVYKKK